MIVRSRILFVLTACVATALLASACGSDSPPTTTTPTGTSCSFSVSQPTTAFGPEGGTGSAAVTAGASCTWTAASSGSFITVTSGATGAGNGTVQFTVAVNTGTDRIATLTIAGTAISITQRAAAPTPAPTLSAPSAKSPIGAVFVTPGRPTLVVNNATSTGSIGTVTYRFEVSDQPSFPADPIRTFTEDGVAQGSGTTSWVVNHDLGANVLWYWRARATNGTVTGAFSAVETFSTGQSCTYTLTPSNASLNGSGGTTTATVTTGSTCAWFAISNDSFLTVSGSGTGNGTITVTAAPNAGASRTGTVSVGGTGPVATFAVTQDVNCVYNPTPNVVTLNNSAFTGQTFVVTTTFPSCAWRAASDSPWLAVTAGDTNTGQGTVTYAVLANGTGAQRIGTINITGFIGGSGSFVVTQQP
jgi:hypothetical protein